MPIFEYRCEQGHVTEDIVLDGSAPVARLDCICGLTAPRQMSRFNVSSLTQGVVADNLAQTLGVPVRSRRDLDRWEEKNGATLRENGDPALKQAYDHAHDEARYIQTAARQDGPDAGILADMACGLAEQSNGPDLSDAKKLASAMYTISLATPAPSAPSPPSPAGA